MLIIRPDAMGDLVVFSPTLLALRDGWPEAKIRVLIRNTYKDIAQLLVPSVEWLGTDIDPYSTNPLDAKDRIESLKTLVHEAQPDLIIAACPRRNWIDMVVANAAPKARHVAFVTKERDPYFGLQLKWAMGNKEVMEYEEVAPAIETEQDWARLYGIADYLLDKKNTYTHPRLVLPANVSELADSVLKKLNLTSGSFVICAPAGSANVKIKSWPLENYVAVINQLFDSHNLKVLVIGHHSELEVLTKIKGLARAGSVEMWAGKEGEIPLLAGLIAKAKLYLGNDTGAMHVAAALDKPGVAVFGGGTWPRFKPAFKQGVTLINPLPCFGCDWDCPFGDAPCVKVIPPAEVIRAVGDLLHNHGSVSHQVREIAMYPVSTVELMARAAADIKERSALHLKREQTLIETAMLAAEKDKEIAMLKLDTDKKLEEIRLLKRDTDLKLEEIDLLKKDTDKKLQEIDLLKKDTDRKLAEIAMLKKETDKKDLQINLLKKDTDTKLAEILSLSKQAKEKDALINEIHSAHEARLKDIARFQKELIEKEEMIQLLHKTCNERQAIIDRFNK